MEAANRATVLAVSMLKALKTHRRYQEAEHKHSQLIVQECIRANTLLYSTLMHDLVKLFLS